MIATDMQKWVCALLVGLVTIVTMLSPGGAAVAQPTTTQKPPTLTIDMLVDPSRALTFEDVRDSDAVFAAVAGNSINLGFTRNAAWLRLSIASSDERAVLLSLTPTFIDELDVYVLGPAKVSHYALGDHRPVPDDALSGLDNVIPLELAADAATQVFIRVAAVNSSLNLTASIYSPAHHTLRTTVSGLAAGAWFGGMAVLLIIQLVFFYFDRKPYFVLLAFSTFMAMLVYLGSLGLSRLFLFPEGGLGNDLFTAGTSWFGLTAGALASASILELRQRAPWLNRIFLAGAAIGLMGVAFAFAGANLVFAKVTNATIIVLATLGAVEAIRTASNDVGGSHLRASAFCILWLGLAATIAQRTGIGSLPDWVAHSYGVSYIVQTILLTGALGVRLRAAEALATAKHVAEEALRAELASQEQQVRFMEVISHQYRTPLATIRSHIDNIGLSLRTDDEGNQRRLERVRSGIARLVEVLEVNLSRSRLQGARFQPELLVTSPAAIVNLAAARARDLLQCQLLIQITAEAERARILADTGMLEIAIINLLENAVKYARPGSREPVSLRCLVDEARVIILVEDQGIGIPAGEIESVLLHSVRGSNARAIAGTGTGLSLVSRIVTAHRGTLEIESELERGTVVKIILPRHPG